MTGWLRRWKNPLANSWQKAEDPLEIAAAQEGSEILLEAKKIAAA